MTVMRERHCRFTHHDNVASIGTLDDFCDGWQIYRGEWGWEVYHPKVSSFLMPNNGYFHTWREAMDFVDEYIRAYDWFCRTEEALAYADLLDGVFEFAALNATPNYSAARAELNNEEARQ